MLNYCYHTHTHTHTHTNTHTHIYILLIRLSCISAVQRSRVPLLGIGRPLGVYRMRGSPSGQFRYCGLSGAASVRDNGPQSSSYFCRFDEWSTVDRRLTARDYHSDVPCLVDDTTNPAIPLHHRAYEMSAGVANAALGQYGHSSGVHASRGQMTLCNSRQPALLLTDAVQWAINLPQFSFLQVSK